MSSDLRPPAARSGAACPELLGPWVPERLLGRGSIASVFLCRGVGGDHAAVKWLHDDHPALVRRFEREARCLARLSHPGVVRWLDQGVWQGRPYLAMEHLDGGDLRRMAPKLHERPPVERYTRCRQIGVALCDALEHLHAHGLVHRDVKPGNVLLGEGGRVVLTDLGVVRELGVEEPEGAGVLIGTPAYAAPEQADGASVDPRADLFGLGATLYYLLTLRRPFSGLDGPERARVPCPGRVDPGVPEDLEAVVMRLMAADPDDRFADAAAARAALDGGQDAGVVIAGRQEAVAAAAAALEQAAAGRAVVLRPVGPMGAGKSWLAALVRRSARREGIEVLEVEEDGVGAAEAERALRRGGAVIVVSAAPLPDLSGVSLIEVPLPPLGMADVRRTVVGLAPRTREPAKVAAALHRATGGIPGLLVPVLARHTHAGAIELPDPLPPPVEVDAFLAGLSGLDRTLLSVMSLQGRPTAGAVLDVVAGEPAAAALAALEARGLVRQVEGRWDLAADFFAAAALRFVPEPEVLRRRIAEARAARLDDPTVPGGGIAALLQDARRAWVGGRLAAALAGARRAAEVAGAVGDRGLEAWALCLLGELLLDLGQPRAARAALADATAMARAVEDDAVRRRSHALRAAAELDERPGARSAAAAATDRLLPLLKGAATRPADPVDALVGAVWARAAAALGDRGAWSRARQLVEDRLPLLDAAQLPSLRIALAEAALRLEVPEAEALLGAAELAASGVPLMAWRAACLRARQRRAPPPPPGTFAEGLDAEQLQALLARAASG